MNANDVKKGMMVTLRDGSAARVEDNLKGMIRTVTVLLWGRNSGGDTGSCYIMEWRTVQMPDGRHEPVTLNPRQQKQAEAIETGMRLYGV